MLTHLGGGVRPVQHPSYQTWSYTAYIENFNEYVYTEGLSLKPCAFLHNYPINDNAILATRYKHHIAKAPVFRKSEASKLASFVKQFVKTGDNDEIIYEVENGKIKPSKGLADAMVGLIKGRQEYILLDEQKEIFEIVKKRAIGSANDTYGRKSVINS